MKKNPWLIGSLFLLTLIILLIGAVKLVVPGLLKKKLETAVHDHCETCTLYLKSVEISFAQPGLLRFHDVRFVGGQGGHAVYEARLTDLYVNVSLSKSNRDQIVIESVEAIDTEVIFAKGDAPKIEEPKKQFEHRRELQILSTKLQNGRFRYVRTKNGHTAILHIHDINGTMGPIGTSKEMLDKMVEAHLTGQIEKSGHAEMDVAALLRSEPWYVDVVLNAENQNVDDLTTFFKANNGVELKGLLVKGNAKLLVRGNKIKSRVEAVYKDASFKELPIDDRTAAKAGLVTLGAKFVLAKTNEGRDRADQTAEVEVPRKGDEKLVHFLLRAAKDGLLEVAKRPELKRK